MRRRPITPPVPLPEALTTAVAAGAAGRTVVLVEGESDRLAVEAAARCHGRDAVAEGVVTVPMGGATNIGAFLDRLGPRGLGARLAGLYDVGEEPEVRRGMERAGLGGAATRAGMEALGFFVCVVDLEDELIRAVGASAVERLLEANGDLTPFRTMQKQPAWRGRPTEQQLRRFMGSGGSRKVRYARLLVEALDSNGLPRPLSGLLDHLGLIG